MPAADKLQYSSGNSASTTLASGITGTDTSAPLTSDTNFAAKSGEGMVIIDEGTANEELAYATTKTGGALTIPLANRGLEGGSATTHASGASVKGILTAGMWNNLIDALALIIDKTAGTIKTGITLVSPILTGPKITKRIQAVTDAATVTPSWDNDDECNITAIAQAFTLANPSGTPTANQSIIIRIKDNATPRAITFGNQYRAIGVTLPTTTTASKTMYLGGKWNATDSKVDILAVGTEA